MRTAELVHERIPLTQLQQLWLTQYAPENFRRMHLVSSIRCTGAMDRDLLRESFEWLAQRHAVLRGSMRSDESGKWMFIAGRIDIELHELSMDGRDVQDTIDDVVMLPFDLESGPLFRVAIVRLGETACVCALVMHHAISDGWSLGIVWPEVLRYCNMKASPDESRAQVPGPPMQYTDVMRQQHQWLHGPAAERARSYWMERFANCDSPVTLPFSRQTPVSDTPLPPVAGSLPKDESTKLAQVARQAGVAFSSAVLAAYVALLASWGEGSTVQTWVCHTGRRRKEALKAIGCFLDVWPLQVRIDRRMTLREVMCKVHSATVEALPMLDLPGAEIGKAITMTHGAQARPGTIFNFRPAPRPGAGQVGRAVTGEILVRAPRSRYVSSGSGMALFATVNWDQTTLTWNFLFDPQRFEDAVLEDVSRMFAAILRQMSEGAVAVVPRWTGA